MNVKWLLADKLIHVIPPFSKGGFSKKKLIHVTSKKKKVDPLPFVGEGQITFLLHWYYYYLRNFEKVRGAVAPAYKASKIL